MWQGCEHPALRPTSPINPAKNHTLWLELRGLLVNKVNNLPTQYCGKTKDSTATHGFWTPGPKADFANKSFQKLRYRNHKLWMELKVISVNKWASLFSLFYLSFGAVLGWTAILNSLYFAIVKRNLRSRQNREIPAIIQYYCPRRPIWN